MTIQLQNGLKKWVNQDQLHNSWINIWCSEFIKINFTENYKSLKVSNEQKFNLIRTSVITP